MSRVSNDTHGKNLKDGKKNGREGNPREKYFSRKDENVIFEKYVLVFIDVDRNVISCSFNLRLSMFFEYSDFTQYNIIYI